MKCICKEFRIGGGDSVKTMNEWFLLHAEDIRIRTITRDQDGCTILVFYEEKPSDEKSRILVFDRALQVIS